MGESVFWKNVTVATNKNGVVKAEPYLGGNLLGANSAEPLGPSLTHPELLIL